MKRIIFIIILLCTIGCSQKNDGIRTGTFEIYENDSLVGKIYRFGNYQIEKYPEGDELIARIDYKTDSTYLLRGIEKVQIGIDSIIWLNKYWKIESDKFGILAVPSNSNDDYRYEAILKKVNEKIDKDYLARLNSLNE